MTVNSSQPALISALLNPAAYDHRVGELRLVETHISWVILTGEYAYKIKKPVDYGFLDFSTLEKRRFCCEEELRLNSRLAASVYLAVVPITGKAEHPVIDGEGEVVEYAVKMRQFPQDAQLDNMLADGRLEARHLDAVAHMAAVFHRQAESAGVDVPYGGASSVLQPVEENFRQIREHLGDAGFEQQLGQIERWSRSAHARLHAVFEQRKRDGFVRECHGDMHLRNLAWYEDAPIAFDCLEFNPALRWIDTMSDLAFLFMDLQDRRQSALAQRVLNRYLEEGGDYEGLAVLPYYIVYRALVRAKVDAIRAGQDGIADAERQLAMREFAGYLDLAAACTRESEPRLVITRGMSASGKSTVTDALIEFPGMIRIRSDVERKRLFAQPEPATENDASGSGINAGIYSAQATEATYTRLAELAQAVIAAGYSVIIDATFLEHDRRQAFRALAVKMHVPCVILEFQAPAAVLKQRIQQRQGDVSDADLAVLEYQLGQWQPLDAAELEQAIRVDTVNKVDAAALAARIRALQYGST